MEEMEILDSDLPALREFKCNGHYEGMKEVFEDLLETGSLVDVTLACVGEQEVVQAHKIILCAGSRHFQKLFLENPVQHYVLLRDISLHQLKAFVKYIYTGVLCIPTECSQSYLRIAESLDIKGLNDLRNLLHSDGNATSYPLRLSYDCEESCPSRQSNYDERSAEGYTSDCRTLSNDGLDILSSEDGHMGHTALEIEREMKPNAECLMKALSQERVETVGTDASKRKELAVSDPCSSDAHGSELNKGDEKRHIVPRSKPWECSCGYAFKFQRHLTEHRKLCGRYFACHACPTFFRRPYLLHRHMTSWHKSSKLIPPKKVLREYRNADRTKKCTYVCRKCSTWFESKDAVVIHEGNCKSDENSRRRATPPASGRSSKLRGSVMSPNSKRQVTPDPNPLSSGQGVSDIDPDVIDIETCEDRKTVPETAVEEEITVDCEMSNTRRITRASEGEATFSVSSNRKPKLEVHCEVQSRGRKSQVKSSGRGKCARKDEEKHSALKLVLACTVCTALFPSKDKMYQHSCFVKQGRYTCPNCNKIFHKRWQLISHHNDCGHKFPCQYCGGVFSRQYTLVRHININHLG